MKKKKGRSQGCYQVSDFPKYMVVTMKKMKGQIWGEAEKFSFRHGKFEKPRGNTVQRIM